MRSDKCTILLLYFLSIVSPLKLYSALTSDSCYQKMARYVRNIGTFNRLFPQEKVYLHLDNTSYFVDEKIWFKAYVVRTDNMQLSDLSKVLYVELLNPLGDVVQTVKVPLEKGQGNGCIPLTWRSGMGFHEIRAYTRYMINWNEAGVFSRVVPVFGAAEKGEYRIKINREASYSRLPNWQSLLDENGVKEHLVTVKREDDGSIVDDTVRASRRNLKKQSRRNGDMAVRFYPEGGDLVQGLGSRVAFEIHLGDSAVGNVQAWVMRANGDTLARATLVREGRGWFYCRPDEEKLYLGIISNPGESPKLFSLPQVKQSGCVLSMNMQSSVIVADITATSEYQKTPLGVSLMHNGSVCYFDTLSIGGPDGEQLEFDRHSLPSGINQITLFTSEGRILAERLFFVYPHDKDTCGKIGVKLLTDTIAPYRKMAFELSAEPGSSVSFSVADVATQLNEGNHQNVYSYLLLCSDLKGYIHRPDYYLESDDAEHRMAADLLTLVQGWRRYDWKVMSGNGTFYKNQPLEKGLYLDGRLLPVDGVGVRGFLKRALGVKKTSGVQLIATLYNEEGISMDGVAETDSLGYFAFKVPNCDGKWKAIIETRLKEQYHNYRVTINRWFSPEPRMLSLNEVELEKPQKRNNVFQPIEGKISKAMQIRIEKTIQLQMANVVGRKERYKYTNDRFYYYDVEAIVDKMKDQGEDPFQYIDQWLLNQERYKKYDFGKLNSILWIKGVEEYLNSSPPLTLTDVRAMRVQIIENQDKKQFRKYGKYLMKVYLTTYGSGRLFQVQHTGVRNTLFYGYNVPQTFQMANYDIVPPLEDYRRTLYWSPDVTIGADGKAKVEFWNNGTCKEMAVSVEGMTPKSQPVVFCP